MITDRDIQVIEWLSEFKVATTTTICNLFYDGKLRVAQRRLTQIVSHEKNVKRTRYTFTDEYTYYWKSKSTQFRHNVLLTNFINEMHHRGTIEQVHKEFSMMGIRPDLAMIYNTGGKRHLLFVECEISHKGFDADKYHAVFHDNKFLEKTGAYPYVVVITNFTKKIKNDRCYFIRTNMGGLEVFVNQLKGV